MPFRPLYDQVLIKRKDPAEKYGSIFIPDSAREKTVEGTVAAVGNGIVNHIHGGLHKLCVKPGDRVLFAKTYTDQDVEANGEKYFLLREDDIAASVGPDGTIRPMHDRVFIDRKKEDEKYGRIVIPETARQKTTEGTVAAVGSGKILESGETIALDLKVGDRVLFGNKYAPTEIEFDGRKVWSLRQDDIAAVLEAE